MSADALIVNVLDRSDYLTGASAHANALAAAALLAFVMGIAIVGIAVALYPLLKCHSDSLGLAYVALRGAELAATLVYLTVPLLVMHIGSGLQDGTIDPSASPPLGALFQGLHGAAVVMIYLVTSVLETILSFFALSIATGPASHRDTR
jgi:hypothetical protein